MGAITAVWKPARVGHQRGHRRHHGLAAADVALEQPVHRAGAGHVGEDLVGRDALPLGELEGQRRGERAGHLDVVGDDHARRRRGGGAARARAASWRRNSSSKAMRSWARARLDLVVGEVHLVQRVADAASGARRARTAGGSRSGN